jgi:hypothetical protein
MPAQPARRMAGKECFPAAAQITMIVATEAGSTTIQGCIPVVLTAKKAR